MKKEVLLSCILLCSGPWLSYAQQVPSSEGSKQKAEVATSQKIEDSMRKVRELLKQYNRSFSKEQKDEWLYHYARAIQELGIAQQAKRFQKEEEERKANQEPEEVIRERKIMEYLEMVIGFDERDRRARMIPESKHAKMPPEKKEDIIFAMQASIPRDRAEVKPLAKEEKAVPEKLVETYGHMIQGLQTTLTPKGRDACATTMDAESKSSGSVFRNNLDDEEKFFNKIIQKRIDQVEHSAEFQSARQELKQSVLTERVDEDGDVIQKMQIPLAPVLQK
ncbi:MAG: hypothetical protein HY390_00955 [Deltaproteobacteria bacterium]|nr:hypothetical protein [Deltaproteobacteria bacterium]